jgi:uncharacterized 2Fe-2S/4Fe-4S cluster protein (DUF4445 family)
MNKMSNPRIIFQPYGKRAEASTGSTILDVARDTGINLSSVCGGEGRCGKCRIIVRSGNELLSSPSKFEKRMFSEEDLSNGFRLACQTTAQHGGAVTVEVPAESRIDQHRLLLMGSEKKVKLAPAVRKVVVALEKPSLLDTRSDVDRLLDALESKIGLRPIVDYETLKKVPRVVRKKDWVVTVTLWNNREIIAVQPGQVSGCYGFAVDVGTTKLAGYLLDLSNGEIVATASATNPQIPYGEDVISRIRFATENPENLVKLQQTVIEGVNQLVKETCKDSGVSPDDVYEMTVSGNTAMHHIFLGIPPDNVALMPYPAALQSSMNVKAKELSLNMNRGAYVHVLPTIAGFVGGDAVADVLATGIHEADELSMLVDIGTNTEIVLGNKDRLVACSCASGPAFEGAHIKYGMRASTGAIEQVWIDPDTFDVGYKTVDNGQPRGLCGSAIVDVVAELFKTKLIDKSGRFNRTLDTPRFRMNVKSAEFVIAWKNESLAETDIVVTQRDIRVVQLAKAAIYTGASILMKHLNVKFHEIQKVFLAGAFGTYVDPLNAKVIGMYPNVSLEKVQFVGNTSGSGARMALLSVEAREVAEKIARFVEYVELGADPNFQNEFLKATYLPHKEVDRFPSVAKLISKKYEI